MRANGLTLLAAIFFLTLLLLLWTYHRFGVEREGGASAPLRSALGERRHRAREASRSAQASGSDAEAAAFERGSSAPLRRTPRGERRAAKKRAGAPARPSATPTATPTGGIEAAASMCRRTMESLLASRPAVIWPPPCPVLPALKAAFEGPAGSMPITSDFCLAQRYEGHNVLNWSEAYIEEKLAGLIARTDAGSYSFYEVDQVAAVFARFSREVAGGVGLVMGSEFPWVEALALHAGAASVWTFEYSTIVSGHPRLKAKQCQAIAADFLAGAFPPVDFVFSFSSLEHSGLGRYGDELQPDGDLEAMRQAWCMLKPGGFLALGVPMTCVERGYIEYNAHRVYGFARLAYIADDFDFLEFESGQCLSFIQPNQTDFAPQAIAVFRKPLSGVSAAEERAARDERMAFPLGLRDLQHASTVAAALEGTH